MKVTITRAGMKSLPRILEIQKLAFRQEAEDFDDYKMEPMQQTLEDLQAEYKTFTYLIALNEAGNIIGSTRGFIRSGTSYIGKTFVHPYYQGRGIGTRLIAELERINAAPRYEINASKRVPRNIILYEHLGYQQFKETISGNNAFVYLEKFV